MAFGEGFYVTVLFLVTFLAVACMASYTKDPVVVDLAKVFGTVISSIAAFWFATRGQTAKQG